MERGNQHLAQQPESISAGLVPSAAWPAHVSFRWSVDGVVSGDEARRARAPLRERLDALGPAPRAELLHVLMLPDFERA
jgi:hypothetical protein